jgi:hypothetical protein
MSRTRGVALWALVLLVAIRRDASGFSYKEHCRISNRALLIAIGNFQRAHPKLPPSVQADLAVLMHEARSANCGDESHRSLAYGHHVSRVDWAITPGDFFVRPVAIDPIQGTGGQRVDSIPWHAIGDLVSGNWISRKLKAARLVHENQEHFGVRAVYSYRLWHEKALAVAYRLRQTQRDSTSIAQGLSHALVYNAFADHYLEDLYAPGHVAAPREGLNDAVTGGMHGYRNDRGAFYRPVTADLVKMLQVPLDVSDSSQPAFAAVTALACPEKNLADCVQGMNDQPLLLRGDKRLSGEPRQELFVTLVVARSVLDVLEASVAEAPPPPAGTFAPLEWCGYRWTNRPQVNPKRWVSPDFRSPYGHYVQEEGRGHIPLSRWPILGFALNFRDGVRSDQGTFEWTTSGHPAGWDGTGMSDKSSFFGFVASDVFTPDQRLLGFQLRRTRRSHAVNGAASSVVRVSKGRDYLEFNPEVNTQLGFSFALFEAGVGLAFRPLTSDGYTGRHVAFTMRTGFSTALPLAWPVKRRDPRVVPPPIDPEACGYRRVVVP